MHGRRLARALWDNFKVNGIIQSSWNPYGVTKSLTDFQDLQTGFSMLRLQELSKQREMYSSLESFSSNDSRDREGSSGSESSCSDEGEFESYSENGDDEALTDEDETRKKVKRKRKKRKDKKEFNYEELVEFTKMSFRRKVLENETSDEGIKVVGHNIFPSSRLSIHEDNFIPPSCIVNLNESLPKTPCSPDPVERLLSIERIRLRTSSMESPPLKSLRSSPIVIGGGGVISSRWKKGEKCFGNKFRNDINLLNEESVVQVGLKENPKRKRKMKSSKS
uniref:Uncharacterized protein n=1 Tax=Lepeophtheirus salmonis TaxID=72036 RepID=A0A0K2U9W4_LEPSM